ncbi:serine protease 27-like [Zootoca vivipara]|uniref:serine protease 27-like n=1 Tax=Zootoca vivipara TaxID=8524 RepID=UPI001591A45F|nr:serine protease 27-like [Zootoca vivipara]XP_034991572.1 serine protease 27-like [Zootoca vivipara]XP_034991573.1 serine protease 27-like [Zootoca vivipara]XP_034991575.1 serine protease 27-like [Zootoca vivipara]XP_034991576.1 serine protease 27-like [Zootoca vivipara]XP_034991577.1 serine protease 27-like [Zootoca vivipara]XP_034991578.1 serine protease 27-like [Zootoca vivipara]XP_034991579.1 serine protease 27-like [Zootoca vivipara]XP_034991580.1 serine protease 27-like [Zootoca viv
MATVSFMLAVWLLQLTILQGAANSTAECGQPINSPRIVGGQPASNGSWPWQVSILRNSYPICGGSLIAKQWVLSAAHCFFNRNGFQYNVLLGANQLSHLSDNAVISDVQQIILHPDYNGLDASSGDIALIKLKSPVKFTSHILPICLPESSAQFPLNEYCWVTGWGNIQSEVPLPDPQTLQELKVPLIIREVCNILYNSRPVQGLGRDPVKQDMICAGYPEGGKDSCQGDSGGPLVCQLKGVWTQAGVVSWGVGCAESHYPGVYTLVPSYANWIQDKMSAGNGSGGKSDQLRKARVVTFTLLSLLLALL